MKFYNIYLIIGLIVLFVGASIFPVIGLEKENNPLSISEIEDTLMKNNKRQLESCFDWPCKCDIIVPDDYPTIQKAIDAANQGDCICVRNGTYFENILIEGYDKFGITLCGEDKNTTIIDGMNHTHTITVRNADDIAITGFKIINSSKNFTWTDWGKSYSFHGILITKSNNCTIYDNVICNNGNGIRSDYTNLLLIEDNQIIQNFDNGIKVAIFSGFCTIVNNYIANNGFEEGSIEGRKINQGDGIEIYETSVVIYIIDNIIENNYLDGIWDDRGSNHQIIGNKISNNGNVGIHMKTATQCRIIENEINNNYRGIELYYGSTNNHIIDNEIFNNLDCGVYIFGSSALNNIISNNISGCIDGIFLGNKNLGQGTTGDSIKCNNIHSNSRYGICLFWAQRVKINCNKVYGNLADQLRAFYSTGDARYNWWGFRNPYSKVFRFFSPIIIFPWCLNEDCPILCYGRCD